MEQTQNTLSRLPPQNEDAERSLLGAILLEGDVMTCVMPLVRTEDFYVISHQKIFESCVHLSAEGRRIDEVLIKDELKRRGDLDAVGGETYLAHLAATVPSAAGAEDYARIVSEKSIARNLIHYCTNIQAAAYEGSLTGDELLDSAQSQVFNLARHAADASIADINQVLTETFQEIFVEGGPPTGIASGFVELDEMTTGLQPGDLIIVAGRPSMGKTTFTNCLVDHASLVEKTSVVMFSLEVNRKHLVRNMLVARARVESHKVRRRTLDQEEVDRLTQAAGELSEAQIFIDDSSMTSMIQLRAKARRIKQKHGLGLVVVDYIQLMETGKAENRQQEIAQISRSLKGLARELEVPVIAISQLNRGVDSREDHRPRMSDLRESGALEQDADLILFLYREEQYKQTPENQGLAEVIVAKHRSGPTGIIRLRFTGELLRFDNLAFDDFPG